MSVSHDPYLHGKVLLVTGGTGSFGTAFATTLPAEHEPAAVRVYSRDELMQTTCRGRSRFQLEPIVALV